jgi:hypothetical protein
MAVIDQMAMLRWSLAGFCVLRIVIVVMVMVNMSGAGRIFQMSNEMKPLRKREQRKRNEPKNAEMSEV